jgi:hypothetical protein
VDQAILSPLHPARGFSLSGKFRASVARPLRVNALVECKQLQVFAVCAFNDCSPALFHKLFNIFVENFSSRHAENFSSQPRPMLFDAAVARMLE